MYLRDSELTDSTWSNGLFGFMVGERFQSPMTGIELMGQLIDGSECDKSCNITEAQEAEKEAAIRGGHFLQRPPSETFPPANGSTVPQPDVIIWGLNVQNMSPRGTLGFRP